MKILIHIGGEGIGGNETLLVTLLSELRSTGHFCSLVCPEGRALEFLRPWVLESCATPKGMEAWVHLLRRSVPDLVVGFHGDIFTMALAAKRLGIKSLWSCGHPQDLAQCGRALSLLFDGIIAQSHFLERYLKNELGSDLPQLRVIHNGVDVETFCPPTVEARQNARAALGIPVAAFCLGYAARLVPYKRHIELISLIRLLSARGESIHLLLLLGVDSNQHQEKLWREMWDAILESDLQSQIHLVSAFPHAMARFYSVVDVCVHPARSEGLGSSVLEGMAMGIPSVVVQSGGLCEMIPNQDYGELVIAGDIEGYASSILKLKGAPEMRKRMGAAARERVKTHFSSHEMVKEYAGVIAELIGGHS